MTRSFLFLLIICAASITYPQDDFKYEEGSAGTTTNETVKKEQPSASKAIVKKQTANPHTPPNTPAVKKQTTSTSSSRVAEAEEKPKSYYRAFVDNAKIGAIVGLVITILLLLLVQNWLIVFPGFPIIWGISTAVMIFVTSC